MTIIRFPTKLPPPNELGLARAQLCELLQDTSRLLLARANQLIATNNASEFAAVVRGVADDTAEASAGWANVSKIIREAWGV
jgi:hypothetical protein